VTLSISKILTVSIACGTKAGGKNFRKKIPSDRHGRIKEMFSVVIRFSQWHRWLKKSKIIGGGGGGGGGRGHRDTVLDIEDQFRFPSCTVLILQLNSAASCKNIM
jgi:hypothetical protein